MTVYRRSADDYLLLTEPELAERVRTTLLRSRFAAKVDVELEEHDSTLVVGRETPPDAIANREYGVAAYELVDDEPSGLGRDRRGRARAPAHPRRRPALRAASSTSACSRRRRGSIERAIDFQKGCYPGQEPIARQHYRGRVNRGAPRPRDRGRRRYPTTTPS